MSASSANAADAPPEFWSLAQAAIALRRRKISSEELTKLCIARVKRLDPKLNSFITLTEEDALMRARACDAVRPAGMLHGIPIALKDNIDTAGVLTTAASKVFRDRIPSQDAEVAARLRTAGTVCLGKLNLDEFALEGTGTTSNFGVVHNPWNLDHIAGGSSAGSATALTARFCYASVGSDDGGSIRIPASFSGITGLKTSLGRVSTRGVIPSAYSLDTIGPMARSAEDAALVLQAIAGIDRDDSITIDAPVPNYSAALRAPLGHLRLGIPRDPFFEKLNPEVAEAVEAAIRLLRPKVREVRDIVLPAFEFVKDGSYDVELLHFHAPLLERSPELYHPWSRRQLTGLKQVTAVNYVETLKRLRECRRDIRRVFTQVDLLLLPTKRDTAPTIQSTIDESYQRPPSNTSAFNRFGVPAISIPCGFSRAGLPIGLQIAGPLFGEPQVLALAHAFQMATDWHLRRPPGFA
ncbi:Asp-tRNA(Asn)/Glu-tRNA(Gln) amidotransferase GatCAB subunit A [Bryobacter aggregatus]|uniref:Asp-tRNA(Asn)/Glu-tRNA(Gln) amidotransferase GatCAB subunit A n=1 Tax=Bryobacter aggregatus TaxID=360054 RepID=UPI00068F08AF|nr:Asp-tRNA(Asn)/Glu-tRNA(Gln) amidotransferase GatCAB subunit A [Bryobacter aggregatus]